jgi:hypothetical protein
MVKVSQKQASHWARRRLRDVDSLSLKLPSLLMIKGQTAIVWSYKRFGRTNNRGKLFVHHSVSFFLSKKKLYSFNMIFAAISEEFISQTTRCQDVSAYLHCFLLHAARSHFHRLSVAEVSFTKGCFSPPGTLVAPCYLCSRYSVS